MNKASFRRAFWHSTCIVLVYLTAVNGWLLADWSIGVQRTALVLSVLWLAVIIYRPYRRETLARNSWLSLAAVVFIGVVIGSGLGMDHLAGIGIAVSVVDILSFTRRGKWTLNAKLMNNQRQVWKLIVYGIGWKDKALVPTIGLGDFMLYTLLVSAANHLFGFEAALYTSALIFAGNILNYAWIAVLYKREGFKGFPATFIPFLLSFAYLLLKI